MDSLCFQTALTLLMTAGLWRATLQSPPRGIRLALFHNPVGLLFPFNVPAGTPQGRSLSTLPAHALAGLSRRTFVDALFRLTREPDETLAKAQVLELTLEYIGRRWREGEDNIIDAISKKLADIEAEVSSLVTALLTSACDSLRSHSCCHAYAPRLPVPVWSG